MIGSTPFATRELTAFQGNFFCEYAHRRTDGMDSNRHQWASASPIRRICTNCHTVILKVDDPDGFNWNVEIFIVKEMP